MAANVKDLTVGKPSKIIIEFAVPVLVSQLFQQLYNTADSLIVGRYLGTSGLAAVSSAGNMVFLMISFFTGLTMGAGVVISKYFGARDYENVSKSIHTNMIVSLLSGLVLSAVGYFATPAILTWMNIDPQLHELATSYYQIYFAGSFTLVLYNNCRGTMSAVGDSKRPLYYLMFSSILNVILDIVFITSFGWGVWSAAFATVISQAVSVVLCLVHLCKKGNVFTLSLSKMKMDRNMVGQMAKFGLPSAVQNSVIGFANVIVQSQINSFGMIATAAFGAHAKIEGFGFLPINSFCLAITTFVSQNLGAKQYERAKKGASFGVLVSIIMAELIGIVIYIFSPKLIGMFDSNPQVIVMGTQAERVMGLFYLLLAFSHSIAAVCRGAGKAFVPMFVMLSIWCVFRVAYIAFVMHFFNDIVYIYWAYPITWFISSIVFLIYWKKSDWVHGFEQ